MDARSTGYDTLLDMLGEDIEETIDVLESALVVSNNVRIKTPPRSNKRWKKIKRSSKIISR